ncbi:MAG: DNA replication and repair protein RecF [Chloroflexi bacterium]|nr:MAG: DNA replication and repair protein RecF [Chloroflexota bacterium]
MRLTRLSLEQYRSYAAAELHPDPGLTIIAGPNGAGKTNLLEAIWVAVTGRSNRAAADHELVRHGAPWARIRLDLSDEHLNPSRVELVVPGVEAGPEVRKRLLVNGLSRRPSSLTETVRAVLFRPEEMLLLVGPPSDRRRFLDGILTQSDRRAARDLVDLARVVAQRNALLRAIRADEAQPAQLDFWDEQLVTIGSRLMAARVAVVARLAERIGALHAAVAAGDEGDEGAGEVRLEYLDSLRDAWPERASMAAAGELEGPFRTRLAEVRQKEIWNGSTLVGPHRDDLRVELAGRDVASHASRGQQRTIILALKLAETELLAADRNSADTGGADETAQPVVLLDDVFSELDAERAARALELLMQRGQVLVTMADLSTLPKRHRHSVAVWQVDAGQLRLAPRVA